jgi:hypothetical protein
MNNNGPEYFEDNNDVIENFDTLNDKYRNHSDWIKEDIIGAKEEINKDDLNPLIAFKSLYLPGQEVNNLDFEVEYKEGSTDPYQRICNLKYEIIDCKTKIDSYAQNFNNNDFLKESQNIGKVLEELDLYKSKLDAFINYNVYNKTADDSQSGDELDTKDFKSIFDKYNRLTENLITHVKQNEKDILNNNFNDFNIKYEICSNPQMQMENLIERVGELEEMLNNLENNIGNWDIVKYFNI